MSDKQQEIEALLEAASREQLIKAVRGALAAAEEARRPLDYADYGIGQYRDNAVVEAERDARVGVADDVEQSLRLVLTEQGAPQPGK
ncbi:MULTISPECIES: hypothetical protein [Streptomyces]|uniref:Uncharacterized protein n=1 Tax=Streptomyces zinciresistens K42 TaxID=700597 RepID=G2GF02_9ACTN|nr:MULTISPECIES: hypothetical protein [Streptomyces]EGX57943.1 hypothetical protein SZN_20427 [Streptomyces zinciresistens K42]MDT9700152.1 hypothetical protein [Streptomyces sp. P17]